MSDITLFMYAFGRKKSHTNFVAAAIDTIEDVKLAEVM